MLMVDAWNNNSLDLFRLNFSLLTLIPKEPGADTIQKFRPIALSNCSFKIFAKCVANQLGDVGDEIISQNQAAFIKGRFIVESVVSAHEIIHAAVIHNKEGFVFKLDYKKAYDRVSKEFLLKAMYQRGFSPRWMERVKPILFKGSLGVRINDCNSDFLRPLKG